MNFSDFDLAPPVLTAISKLGYTTPTPIQAQSIPIVIKGQDILGIAQTGTGKTAAFALPILHHLCTHDRHPPKRGARVLVLAPTRELASQIAVSFREYAQFIEAFYVTAVFGGVPVSRQIKKLVHGNHVLVATPGRLLDLIDQKALRLSDVEILVLDEADQMMDMGFIHALRKVVPLLPPKRQTLFFSATMPKSIANLASQFLTHPQKVSVTPANTTAERVTQAVTFVNSQEKQALLALALLNSKIDRALIFTRTKHGADRVVKRLARTGIEAAAIHGNKSQSQRQRTLRAFREGEIKFLVATDIAARGIDIEGISHVFNFEIPNVAEQYVHRIGRTARAGRSGLATSYVSPDEKAYLKDIQKLLKMTIPVEPLPENFIGLQAELKKRKSLPLKPKPEATPRNPKSAASRRGMNKKQKNERKDRKAKFTQKQQWSPEKSAQVELETQDMQSSSTRPHKGRNVQKDHDGNARSKTRHDKDVKGHKDRDGNGKKHGTHQSSATQADRAFEFKRKPRQGSSRPYTSSQPDKSTEDVRLDSRTSHTSKGSKTSRQTKKYNGANKGPAKSKSHSKSQDGSHRKPHHGKSITQRPSGAQNKARTQSRSDGRSPTKFGNPGQTSGKNRGQNSGRTNAGGKSGGHRPRKGRR